MSLSGFGAQAVKLDQQLEKLNTTLSQVGAHMEGANQGMQVMFGTVVRAIASVDTLLGKLDRLVMQDAPRAFPILQEMLRKLAAGEITMAQFEMEFVKLQALNAQANGALGDLDKLLLDIRRAMGEGLPDEAAGAGPTPGPNPDRPWETGNSQAGIGGSGGGDLGSSSSGFPSGPTSAGGMGDGGGGDLGSTSNGFPKGPAFHGGMTGLVASSLDRAATKAAAEKARVLRQLELARRRARR